MTMVYTKSELRELERRRAFEDNFTVEQIQNLPADYWNKFFAAEAGLFDPPEAPEQERERIWQLIVDASRNG